MSQSGLPHRPDASSARVRVRVPAKINLFLAVRGRRADGYHELVSIMQTIGLHDELTAAIVGDAGAAQHPALRPRMQIDLAHDSSELVPTDDRNLAMKAARILLREMGAPVDAQPLPNAPATHVDLHKVIPVAAGMAGGSADAAAALIALNALWGCELTRDELRELAAELGADVPFCVLGGTALATGTGSATAQVLVRGTYHWMVGMSADPLSTAHVYETFAEVGTPSEVEPDAVLHALRTGDAEALGAALYNDLEQAAFHLRPSLRAARDALLDAGALGAVLSGSGPTMLALAENQMHANELAERSRGLFERTAVAPSPAGAPELDREP